FAIVPGLTPANPPSKPPTSPVTFPLAEEFAIAPPSLETEAPASAWQNAAWQCSVSAAGGDGAASGPALEPTKPPTWLAAPPLTLPLAVDARIEPPLAPTRPPTEVPMPPVTAPVADELVMVPAGKLDPAMVNSLGMPRRVTLAPTRPPTE